MLKSPRAPVSGFTPQVRRATPGTAQQVAKDTASSGLEENRAHEDRSLTPVNQRAGRGTDADENHPPHLASDWEAGWLLPVLGHLPLLFVLLAGGNVRGKGQGGLDWNMGPVRPGLTLLICTG